MGDDDETGAVQTVQRQHQFEHVLGGLPVEVAGRLVGQHAGRFGDQRPGDGCPLTLATGQFRRRVVESVPQPDLREYRRRPSLGFGFRHPADEQRHGHVFQRGKLRQQVMELIDEAEMPIAHFAAFRIANLGQIAPHQPDRAAARTIQPAQQVQ